MRSLQSFLVLIVLVVFCNTVFSQQSDLNQLVSPLEHSYVTVDDDFLTTQLTTFGKVSIYSIQFERNESAIKPESAETIKAIADFLNRSSEINLYVVGHTDMPGLLESNTQLSIQRAQNVVNELVNVYQVPQHRLKAVGVGPVAPIATNATLEGRALNNRLELVLMHCVYSL